MEFTGIVRVLPDNTVNISFGEDAVASRQVGFQKAQALLAVDAKGFDPTNNMELVVPRTPFKPDTSERWPDVGLHATVALQGRVPWTAEDGTPDVISPDMQRFAGREIQLAVDSENWHFLEGSPSNDEGTGLVFYLAAFLDGPSRTRIAQFRTELGLGAVKNNLHMSLAGVAPTDGDFVAFRRRFCRPRPPAGTFPAAYHQLSCQTEAEGA